MRGFLPHLHHRPSSTVRSITEDWGRGDLPLFTQSRPGGSAPDLDLLNRANLTGRYCNRILQMR